MREIPRLFVTGTDTGIGKTYLAAHLAEYMLRVGLRPAYYKPIQTGTDMDAESVQQHLSRTVPGHAAIDCWTGSTYCMAASPHLAASSEGMSICLDDLKSSLQSGMRAEHDLLIIEGAGGIHVPIRLEPQVQTMGDLAAELGCTVLIVSQNRLGVINQVCLTAAYCRQLDLRVLGFSLLGRDSAGYDPTILASNISTICQITGLRHLEAVESIWWAILDLNQ